MLILDLEVAGPGPLEKRAKNRLQNVLGIDAADDAPAQPPPRQRQQLLDVAVVNLAGGILVAGTPEIDQFLIIARLGHLVSFLSLQILDCGLQI